MTEAVTIEKTRWETLRDEVRAAGPALGGLRRARYGISWTSEGTARRMLAHALADVIEAASAAR